MSGLVSFLIVQELKERPPIDVVVVSPHANGDREEDADGASPRGDADGDVGVPRSRFNLLLSEGERVIRVGKLEGKGNRPSADHSRGGCATRIQGSFLARMSFD